MEIKLKSKKFGDQLVLIDNEDAHLIQGFSLNLAKRKKTFYVDMYKINKKDRTYLHRLILQCKKGELVDHINNNGLDNRRNNLRLVDNTKNSWNSSLRKNNTSSFKGVSFHKQTKKWGVRINIDGSYRHIGLYETKEEAAIKYNEIAKKHRGEYAFLNNV